MGNILHDWGLETKKVLLKKAYEALTVGGAFIAIESIFGTERKDPSGLCLSLTMLLETDEGFDYSEQDFTEWALEIGFKSVEFKQLANFKAGIAYK